MQITQKLIKLANSSALCPNETKKANLKFLSKTKIFRKNILAGNLYRLREM